MKRYMVTILMKEAYTTKKLGKVIIGPQYSKKQLDGSRNVTNVSGIHLCPENLLSN